MQLKQLIVATSVMLASSIAMAEPAPKAVDLNKLYGLFEKEGFSSLELMETTKRVLISGVVLDVSCLVSCDHIPRRSWPLFRARAMLGDLIAGFGNPGIQSHQEQLAA